MPLVEIVRNGEVENAVAEELEPLVRRRGVGCPVGMSEDVLEPLRRKRLDQVLELVRFAGRRAATGAL
jgi:hypothetical protein